MNRKLSFMDNRFDGRKEDIIDEVEHTTILVLDKRYQSNQNLGHRTKQSPELGYLEDNDMASNHAPPHLFVTLTNDSAGLSRSLESETSAGSGRGRQCVKSRTGTARQFCGRQCVKLIVAGGAAGRARARIRGTNAGSDPEGTTSPLPGAGGRSRSAQISRLKRQPGPRGAGWDPRTRVETTRYALSAATRRRDQGFGALPARSPHLAARRRPIFLRMKLAPMNALEATASARPLVLSETAPSIVMVLRCACAVWLMPPNVVPGPNPPASSAAPIQIELKRSQEI